MSDPGKHSSGTGAPELGEFRTALNAARALESSVTGYVDCLDDEVELTIALALELLTAARDAGNGYAVVDGRKPGAYVLERSLHLGDPTEPSELRDLLERTLLTEGETGLWINEVDGETRLFIIRSDDGKTDIGKSTGAL